MSKIGYKNDYVSGTANTVKTDKTLTDTSYLQNDLKIDNQSDIAEASIKVFDFMVTRNYLHDLVNCNVKPLDPNLKLSPVKWFRIDKIVIERNTFFADKLSMLYMSLHKMARNVILVLNKHARGDVELYLGARDFIGKNRISGEILKSGLEGFFPGIGVSWTEMPNLYFDHPSVSSVSAIASLRDDKKHEFIQGVERLINATSDIPQFRTYFIADSIPNKEAKEMIEAFNNLYTRLSPAETLQMTYNENESKSVSKSFTENFSKSIGESISKTVTHTKGGGDTVTHGTTNTKGTSENISPNALKTLYRSVIGGVSSTGNTNTIGTNYSDAVSTNFSDSEADQNGTSTTETRGTSNNTGNTDTTTKGISKQITYKNRTVKYYLDTLDKQLERLQYGEPFGLWSVATYFVANDSTTAQQLANIYRGSIIGEESGLETCAVNTWTEENNSKVICNYLTNSIHPRFDFNSIDVSAGSIVTSKELAIHLSLPQSSVPGIIVEERASFARNINSSGSSSDFLTIGNIIHLGKESQTPVNIDIDELTKHTFVTGSTGSGKSNTMYLILSQLRDKNKTFMVIEPAKGEYKHVFGCLADVTVYSNTNKVGEILHINPFVFPYKHIDVLEHIDRLIEIFNACWPMYAAMPVVLKHSIIKAYEKCGWNINSSEHKLSSPIFPSFSDVIVCLKDYIDNSEYSDDTKGDYKGALQVRLQDLCEGMFHKILNNGSINDNLFFNKNVIVDLSRIGSSETKSLIMGFIVMKLNEFRMTEGGMNKKMHHVTVLEEAHNLLKKTSTEQSLESSNLTGKSVEMISNSIAEMRTYGEAFIIVDQSPSMLDSSAIRNTNTKIILSLPEIGDRKTAGASMSLSDEQIEEISRQKQGEAIVYQNNWEAPVQCKINKFQAYKNDYVYDKCSKCDDCKPDRIIHTGMINFLLYPYIDKGFNIEDIKIQLDKSVLPASVKFTLLDVIEEYKTNGFIKIWDEHYFEEIAQLIRSYLGMDSEYQKILSGRINISKIRNQFDFLLQNKISKDLDIRTLFILEACYLWNTSLYDEWRKTFDK